MRLIVESILASQAGDQEAMLKLIQKFRPLLKKYIRRLFMEDAESELTLQFIEIISNLDMTNLRSQNEGAIINYICTAMYHAYCKTQLRQRELQTVDIEEPVIQAYLTTMLDDDGVNHLPPYPAGLLSPQEEKTVRSIYEQGYSAAEIARVLGVTRQSVNQMKMRALKKLKNYYEKEFPEVIPPCS